MTKVVGITGGIGSGKSTLIKHIKKRRYPVHDSDSVVKTIYKKPTSKFKLYLNKIGLKKSIKKNRIDKKDISKTIFSNPKLKNKLELFIHAEVKKKRDMFIKKHKKNKTNLIFIDVPLLLEKKLDKNFNIILSLLCPKIKRLRRVKKFRNIPESLFKLILNNQTSDVERLKRSDYCIYNNKSKKMLFINFDKFLKKINT